ncbi:MAG: hypothetical protein EA402_01345 [Planctomycetota bacterium]|nr:MAG: hypothetical protein EA402_01345 [Planctomycetota bacterium]
MSDDICGEQLGADVRNSHSQILLTAGTTLTPTHLRTLRMWGIRRIILAKEVSDSPTHGPISREQIERSAVVERRRFATCDLGHPAVHQLFLIAVRRRAESRVVAPGTTP